MFASGLIKKSVLYLDIAFPFSISTKITDSLAVGINIALVWGPYEQDLMKSYSSSEVITRNASFNMFLEQSGMAVTLDAGMLWKIRPNLSVGILFRAPYTMRKEGSLRFKYDSYIIPFFPAMEMDMSSKMVSEWNWPMKIGAGIGYSPTPGWKVAFDLYWIQWSKFSIEDTFPDELMTQFMFSFFTSTFIKYWEINDGFMYKLGLEYLGVERFPIRVGCYYDPSPVKDEWASLATPRYPDALPVTVGVGFRGFKFKMFKREWKPSFDLGFMYSFTKERTGPNGVAVDGGSFDGNAGGWIVS